ncbi:MAG TPA: hypothetical protein VLD66_02520, partial [Methyloceanibacter sp.]|nr:hypothetical protein [Methyloceanibacter sp.]
ARQVTTEIAPLIYRTQGLQLYRDAQFGLCIDRLNGDLPKEEYEQAKRDRFNRALELIRFEIPYMKEASVEYFKSVQAGENKIDIDKLKALLARTSAALRA